MKFVAALLHLERPTSRRAQFAIRCVVAVVFCAAFLTSVHAETAAPSPDRVFIRESAALLKLEKTNSKRSVYVDFSKITQGDFKDFATEIEAQSKKFVGEHFTLASSRMVADYLLLLRVNDYLDYGTRNRNNVPSNTLITVVICRLPPDGDHTKINQVRDCRNTNFSYFSSDPIIAKFEHALDLWWSQFSN